MKYEKFVSLDSEIKLDLFIQFENISQKRFLFYFHYK